MSSAAENGLSSLGAIANDYGSSSEEDSLESMSKDNADSGGQKLDRILKIDSQNYEKFNSFSRTLHCNDDVLDRQTRPQRLPPPSAIVGLFVDSCDDVTRSGDFQTDHQGRLRAFPHERGNWATYVYLEYCPNLPLAELIDDILSSLDDLQPCGSSHISLSRTVVFRHHWILPFVESLKQRLVHFNRFCVAFGRLEAYVNEEESRSFLSLKVGRGSEHLHRLVTSVDASLQEYNLPTFYKNPSFHMSIGWCLGNQVQCLKASLPKLQAKLDNYCLEELSGNHVTFGVDQLTIKSGNKVFFVPLT